MTPSKLKAFAMTVSQNGKEFIKSFEGCRLKAYQDQAGVWTIGYGSTILRSTGKRVQKGDKITQQEAEELLNWEIWLKQVGVTNLIFPYKLKQCQFDSLVSFAFNLGIGSLGTSTLLRKLRANSEDPTIRTEFMRWDKIKIKGQYEVSDGLARRRKKEADLYFSETKVLA